MLDVAIRSVEAIAPEAGEVLNVFGGLMTVKIGRASCRERVLRLV